MDVEAIRDALEAYRDLFSPGDKYCTCNPYVGYMCENCARRRQATNALAALSTIDPDAIRAEARAEATSCIEALKRIRSRAKRPGAASGADAVYCFMEAEKALAAILADEPKESSDREGLLYKSDVDDRG